MQPGEATYYISLPPEQTLRRDTLPQVEPTVTAAVELSCACTALSRRIVYCAFSYVHGRGKGTRLTGDDPNIRLVSGEEGRTRHESRSSQ